VVVDSLVADLGFRIAQAAVAAPLMESFVEKY
jgi:hypothetical protein